MFALIFFVLLFAALIYVGAAHPRAHAQHPMFDGPDEDQYGFGQEHWGNPSPAKHGPFRAHEYGYGTVAGPYPVDAIGIASVVVVQHDEMASRYAHLPTPSSDEVQAWQHQEAPLTDEQKYLLSCYECEQFVANTSDVPTSQEESDAQVDPRTAWISRQVFSVMEDPEADTRGYNSHADQHAQLWQRFAADYDKAAAMGLPFDDGDLPW